MKFVPLSRLASAAAWMILLASASVSLAQTAGSCTEISNDVRSAVEKDPSKVLMVVEDALVINEGCAADIVKTAISASKADPALAGQIVQTAVSVAPKMAGVITDAAGSVVPGLAVVTSVSEIERPITVGEKNPGKNPIIAAAPVKEDWFFVPSSIRGVFLLQPPASGPLPPPRTTTNPVSPSNAIP